MKSLIIEYKIFFFFEFCHLKLNKVDFFFIYKGSRKKSYSFIGPATKTGGGGTKEKRTFFAVYQN